MMHKSEIEIVEYSPEYKEAIRLLNYEWLEKYFSTEPNDVLQLNNPEKEILDKKGVIYYAKLAGYIVGTASLMYKEKHVYELSKMAVTAHAQGKGIGKMLMSKCIEKARELKAVKLILYSNTRLSNAIAIYKQYGFIEIAMKDKMYARSNIYMEKYL